VEPREIVVVGTVRSVAKNIFKNVTALVNEFKPLGNIYFFLVESDSDDNTLIELNRLSQKFPNFSFVSLGNIRNEIPDRVERLIFCRNRYIQEIRSRKVFRESQYIFIIDLDNSNNHLKANNIEISLKSEGNWGGLFANQKGRYYDILALRHPIWCPNSVLEEIYWYSNSISKPKAKKLATYNRMIRLPAQSGLIPVQSAFGGFAVYKTKHLLNHDYTPAMKDNSVDIDHVILNRKIINSGSFLYIDSQLLNCNWTSHSLQYYRIYRVYLHWKKRLFYWSKRLHSLFKKV
jgi:hypothetical protein